MTLYRQLLFFVLGLLFILFAGTWLAGLQSTRTFLQEQLHSHAQDTATSLGLSLSTHLANQDRAAMEAMVNAIFDRGYYRIIRLNDLGGQTLIERHLDIRVQGVPGWFVHLVPLRAPSATAKLMNGWRQAGTLFVQSHPGYAYKTLWETGLRTALWFGFVGLVTAVLGSIVLRILLRPLRRVEHQALSLCERRYEIQKELPHTRELRRVVEAMNRMTEKVREMFEEQAETARHLQQSCYCDTVTGLGNRRFLENQIAAALKSELGTVKGAFCLLRIHHLKEINEQRGMEAGDQLLERVGELLQKSVSGAVNQVVTARLTGGDFAIFLPDLDQEEGEAVCSAMAALFTRLAREGSTLAEGVGNIGAVLFNDITDFGSLLAVTDEVLREAVSKGPNGWVLRPLSHEAWREAKGRQQWKTMLAGALEEQRLVLFCQPCARPDKQLLHEEVLARLVDPQGKLISAGVFLPTVESLDLISRFDRLVLEKTLAALREGALPHRVALNIFPGSLAEPAFLRLLESVAGQDRGISLEMTELAAVQNLELLRSVVPRIQEMGHDFGLDHFGQSLANFSYLKSLRPDYVKIDRAYTDELTDRDSDAYFFIGALCGVARSLDIRVIAEGVETEEQYTLLENLKINAMQGYYLARPRPVER
jgi:diguanylate cyclase (GGDEF)-like protein